MNFSAKKQKVLLIRSSFLPGLLGLQVVPPIGVLTLAAVLRKERASEIECRVLDTGCKRMDADMVAEAIRDYDPDVVGVSTLTIEASAMHRIAAKAKAVKPSCKVIVGGPHASSFYDKILEDVNVDFCVIGEGETTIVALLDAIRDGGTVKPMPGVAMRGEGGIEFGGPRPFIEDLDSIPMPAWDMIDLADYDKFSNAATIVSRSPVALLFTSRACPYRCIYCHDIFGKKFRAQSPERVIEEIKYLTKSRGAREFFMADDCFNFDRERSIEIAEAIVENDLDIKMAFSNGIRGDIMTKDQIEALARAGAYSMTFAVETASPRLQKMIQKNINLDKLYNSIEWAFGAGMITGGFFMFGFPTETREEMEETARYAIRSKILKGHFFHVILFPRTYLHEMAKKLYPDFKLDYDYTHEMHYYTQGSFYSKVSGIDVEAVRRNIFRRFYLDPWRISNLLWRVPKNKTLLNAGMTFVSRGLGLGFKQD